MMSPPIIDSSINTIRSQNWWLNVLENIKNVIVVTNIRLILLFLIVWDFKFINIILRNFSDFLLKQSVF